MGLLDFFGKGPAADPLKLPSGSFSVDRNGHILSSTLPQSFPAEFLHAIAREVLSAFHEAQKSQLAFSELHVRFSGFKIAAREMRGGALIFLSPQAP